VEAPLVTIERNTRDHVPAIENCEQRRVDAPIASRRDQVVRFKERVGFRSAGDEITPGQNLASIQVGDREEANMQRQGALGGTLNATPTSRIVQINNKCALSANAE
jgi:hypothetical protein